MGKAEFEIQVAEKAEEVERRLAGRPLNYKFLLRIIINRGRSFRKCLMLYIQYEERLKEWGQTSILDYQPSQDQGSRFRV